MGRPVRRVRVEGPGYLKLGESSWIGHNASVSPYQNIQMAGGLKVGWIGVGDVAGNDPCPAVTGAPLNAGILLPPPATRRPAAIQPVTWGRLKTLVH